MPTMTLTQNLVILLSVVVQLVSLNDAFLAPVFPTAHTRSQMSDAHRVRLQMSMTALEKDSVKSPEETTLSTTDLTANAKVVEITPKDEQEKLSETQKLMKQVKESGVAGIISYALWELGFWTISVRI